MTTKTTNLTIRMNLQEKKMADALFSDLGMSLSVAFHIFIRQSMRVQGLPFAVTRNVPNADTLAAMREAELLANDPNAKGFSNMEGLIKDLNS